MPWISISLLTALGATFEYCFIKKKLLTYVILNSNINFLACSDHFFSGLQGGTHDLMTIWFRVQLNIGSWGCLGEFGVTVLYNTLSFLVPI